MNPMIIMLILFVILLLINMPLAFTIGIASISAFYLIPGMNIQVAVQRMTTQTQSFTFLAVPFFLIAGNIMNEAGITSRLVKFSRTLTGHMAGGLAQVSVVLSALMGGISGSAVADACMEARFLGPAMIESGYSKGFIGVVLSFGGLITATIPPSLGLIVYGFVGEVSIGKLFVAGIIPGILMTIILMTTTHFISKKRHYIAEDARRATLKEVLIAAKDSFWALLFPVILIVGIRFGFFTASEAGAFACVYAIFVGKFVYKELTWEGLLKVFDQSITDNGNILTIVCIAGIFGYVSSYCNVPRDIAKLITGISQNRYVILFVIVIFLTFMGMLMESTVNCLLFTPIFLPIVKSIGVDPVHFGIIMMTVVTMGCMTPPVGVSMFAVCGILDCSTSEYIKECLPYFIAIMIEVVLLVLFPQISLALPNLLF